MNVGNIAPPSNSAVYASVGTGQGAPGVKVYAVKEWAKAPAPTVYANGVTTVPGVITYVAQVLSINDNVNANVAT